MHDLSAELNALSTVDGEESAREQAMLLESRQLISVHRELVVALYFAVATFVAGVGLLVKANLDRIGPVALLTGIFAAAALCYFMASRALRARRAPSLGEDYVLLLGALLFTAAVGYAEVKFHVFGAGWSRHLLLLAAWHLATAYLFHSRLVLSVALTAFAGWLGVEAGLGTLFEPLNPLLGAGPRSLLCALLFYLGSRVHLSERLEANQGFRDVYLQFAANFGFWGALALGADSATRWLGALILLVLAVLVGMLGLRERRQSFLLYTVGYSTIGLIWLETLLLGRFELASLVGLLTVIGAITVLMSLRARLRDSAA